MKRNLRQPFSHLGRKPLSFMTIALVAVTAPGIFLLSDSLVTVSAQRTAERRRTHIALERTPRSPGGSDENGRESQVATPGMLTLALNFGAAADYAVFDDKGNANSNSKIVGKIGLGESDQMRAEVGDQAGIKAQQDLSKAFAVLENLPCAETNSEMRNGDFKAGVYCASSGDLKGEFVLDGFGDPNSIFIFRADGKISVEADFSLKLINGAAAPNVFFVAGDTATVGARVNFSGNIVARNTISVAEGSTVNGRALSVEGKVESSGAAIEAATGVLQICKVAGSPGLAGRIFRFQIGSEIILVPVGSCSGAITLPEGPVVVDELIDGPVTPSGSFSGRFRLVAVASDPGDAIVDKNLPTRRVTVNIRPGDVQNKTILTFTNVFAINALTKICKYAAPDVTATGGAIPPGVVANSNIRDRDVDAGTPFEFTIDALLNTVFTVPVGECSPSIQVNVPTTSNPAPAPATLLVTEIGKPGYLLQAASTIPADRFFGLDLNIGVNNTSIACISEPRPLACFFINPGGGVADIDVLEGGAASETTVNFFNRSQPGVVEVCKVAGPGIPIGTRFEFSVYGREPSTPTVILPGTDTTKTVSVPAGPAPLGFCAVVRNGDSSTTRYIVGSQVLITENPVPLDPVPGVPPGDVRVSSIRLDAGAGTFESPAHILHSAVGGGGDSFLDPNPHIPTRQAIFRARRAAVQLEFTDYVFTSTANQGIGLYYNSSTVFLKNDPTPGPADSNFTFGTSSVNNHKAIAGDWNNDGVDTIGLYDPGTGYFFLTDVNYSGPASNKFQYGASNQGYLPVVGDWDGDGDDTVGLYHPATGTFFLRNSNSAGVADVIVSYGPGGANIVPIVGDWDGDGDDTVGIYDSNTGFFFLKNSNTPGSADLTFPYGAGGGAIPVVGDWDGNGTDTVGIYVPSGATFFLRNSNSAGPADIPPFTFSNGGGQPIAGDWAP